MPEIQLGDESSAEHEKPLEEKYRDQMRQIIPQKIELPISTLTSPDPYSNYLQFLLGNTP
jgi:hypothetical protein